jgi:nucleotide-binding universal stress UspA family protein
MHLMRKCPCPVWIIKPTDHVHYRRILAAVDQDSEDTVKDVLNRQILEMSTSLAIAESSDLHIVHVWTLAHESLLRSRRLGYSDADIDAMVEEEEHKRRRWLENLVNELGVQDRKDAVDYLEPHIHLEEGHPRLEVPRLARELDVELIVMGTVGRVGIPGFFMGNTAEEILDQIDCSVVAIKPPGFESPVSLN